MKSGSLWEPRDPEAKSPLEGITVRSLTPSEVAELREAAVKAERESPFKDYVWPWWIVSR